jgi:DNA-binding CsgD family transcriptional regulator
MEVRTFLRTQDGAGGGPARYLDVLPHAALVVDAGGRLRFANRKGEALMGPGGPLTLRDRKVRARTHKADTKLRDLIVSAGLGFNGHGGAMSLPVDDRSRLRLVVAPWRAGEITEVIVLVDDPGATDASLPAKLAGLYGLTTAEAETVATLTEGLSPAEVAEARRVSLATVRTQIHQALRKSDARTVTELVRLAASLPRLDANHV